MPSGPIHWHKFWSAAGPNGGDGYAAAYLVSRGFVLTRTWDWRPPPGMTWETINDKDRNAINYLTAEWDYGTLLDAPVRRRTMGPLKYRVLRILFAARCLEIPGERTRLLTTDEIAAVINAAWPRFPPVSASQVHGAISGMTTASRTSPFVLVITRPGRVFVHTLTPYGITAARAIERGEIVSA